MGNIVSEFTNNKSSPNFMTIFAEKLHSYLKTNVILPDNCNYRDRSNEFDEYILIDINTPINYHVANVAIKYSERIDIEGDGIEVSVSFFHFNGTIFNIFVQSVEDLIDIISTTQELLRFQITDNNKSDLDEVRIPNHLTNHWIFNLN